jgi:hypothetical protein
MQQLKLTPHHADAFDSYTGNLPRASLLPGELAERSQASQAVRANGYLQPGGASIYQWADGIPGNGAARGHSHLVRGVQRDWWHWPTIAVLVTLAVSGLILAMSDSGIGANIALMLHKLI